MAKIKLVDLFECVQAALVDLGVTKNNVDGYRYSGFYHLQRFFEKKGCVYYSRKIAAEFVADTLNAYKKNLISSSKYQRIRKVVAMLEEYQKTGAIKWKHLPKHNTPSFVNKDFESILERYSLDMNGRYSPNTTIVYKSAVKQFLLYLEERGHQKIDSLTRKIISEYIPIAAKRQPSMSNVIGSLKSFLKYLYDNKNLR